MSLFGTTGSFGTQAQTTAAPGFSFGSNLNKPLFPQTSTTTTSAAAPNLLFGQQQQAATAATSTISNDSEIYQRSCFSIASPLLFGDSKDGVVTKLNQLQAFAGCGKGYFSRDQPAVPYNLSGVFCRFKAICYNEKDAAWADSDGMVGMTLERSAEEVEKHRQLVVEQIFKLLGNKPSLQAHIESIKPGPDNRCEVIFYVVETSAVGTRRRISASELSTFLNQTTILQQVQSSFGVNTMVYPRIETWDSRRLEEYLKQPPFDIDPFIWKQAQKNNPDPEKLIPCPIRGFDELKSRHQHQLNEIKLQNTYMQKIHGRIENMGRYSTSIETRIQQLRSVQDKISFRLIRVIATMLSTQRYGSTMDQSEEQLQCRLEALVAKLNAPSNVKTRFNELLSIARCRPHLLQIPDRPPVEIPPASAPEEKIPTEDEARFQNQLQYYVEKFQNELERQSQMIKDDSNSYAMMTKHINQDLSFSSLR